MGHERECFRMMKSTLEAQVFLALVVNIKAMKWFVARTYAGAEWTAHRGLLRRGVECFYPHMFADARRGRWLQAAIKPQFPTYLFACIKPGESTQAILTTVGIRNILRNGVEFVTLPPRQVEEIRRQCADRYRESVPRLTDVHRWRIGDVVPVPYGSLAGLPVQITATDRGRVVASLGNLDVTFHVAVTQEREAITHRL